MFAPILSRLTGSVGVYILYGVMVLIAASSLISFIKAPLEREIVSLRQAAKDLEKIGKRDAARAEAAEHELTSQKEATDVFVQNTKAGSGDCRLSAPILAGLRDLANGKRR